MKLNARLLNLFSRTARGRRSLSTEDLATNFSFVLHQSSSSATVHQAVEAERRHRRVRARIQETVLDGDPNLTVDTWITTSIGLPNRLDAALRREGLPVRDVIFIDRRDSQLQPAVFFRDQAELSLPSRATGTVGVAALIMRPRASSQQLIVRGPFDWKTGRKDALRALEEVIQAHVEQWMPESRLWIVPVEAVFPDEAG
jgi:hypothetical protein